jgi:signal peptidase II
MKRRQALVFAAILALCVGCDHTAKHVAQSALGGSGGVSLCGDTIRFELAHNPGAFLSTGSRLPPAVRRLLFLVTVPAALAVVCGLSLRAGFASRASLLGLGLVAGGGLGNWLDRLLHDGAVTDFVSLGLGPLRTGVFNVADVCVMAGLALTLLAHARRNGSPRPAA